MSKEFSFINLFRASAAYWVLIAHCAIWGGWTSNFALPNPKIAVDLFMIISGFLMAANADARAKVEPLGNKENWTRFWLRRFFRLAPGYYLSLFVAICTSTYFLAGYHYLQGLTPSRWPQGGVYDPLTTVYDLKNIFLHLTFLFGLSPTYSFSTFLPDWSLSLEMQFYILFPFLYIVLSRFGFAGIGAFLGLGCFVIGVLVQRRLNFEEPSLLVFKLNYFISGILVYRFLVSSFCSRTKPMLGFIAVGLVSLDVRYGYQMLLLPILVLFMLMLGWLEVHKTTPDVIARLVNSKIVNFASNSSYAVYLFHGFYISSVGLIIGSSLYLQALNSAQRVFFMIIYVSFCTYLTAHIIFIFVEKPFINFGKEFIRRFMPSKS